ncbi:MAG: SurA N-terminal domain-containing protein [Candidatus Levybacteria bacterium]|nr:SurA N-terminal domain-containing protein [Candidatus Levybacteria bacterium]
MASRKTSREKSDTSVLPINTKSSGFGRVKNSRIFYIFIILVIAGILFYFKGFFIAALVNGQPISRLAIIEELERRDGKNAMTALVNQALIMQEAKKKNIEVNQEEINAASKEIEDSLKKQGQNLDSALTAQGMTRKDFEDQLKIRKLVEKLLANDIKVTDKEINGYIDQNKDLIPKDLKAEEVTASARQQLEQQKLSVKSQEWLASLEKNAKINYFVNY